MPNLRVDDELLTYAAFRLFQSEDGQRVLKYLKKEFQFENPSYDPRLPVEHAVFRDGNKQVIQHIEFVTANLDQILREKMEENRQHGNE